MAVLLLVCGAASVSAAYLAPTGTSDVVGTVCANTFQNIGPFHVAQSYTGINGLDNPEDIGAAHQMWMAHGSNVAYLGGVNGGVWKTDNLHGTDAFGGPHWYPTSDYMPCLNIGALSGSADDASFVVAGCGYVSNSNNRGGEAMGVMISGDAAATWTMSSNFPKGFSISSIAVSGTLSGTHRIVVSARSYKVILSATTGREMNPYGLPQTGTTPAPDSQPIYQNGGIWVSTNGGVSWTQTYGQAVTKLLRHPNVPTTMYAFGMLGSTFTKDPSMTPSLLVSTDEGGSWSPMPTMPDVATACPCNQPPCAINNVAGALSFISGQTIFTVGFFVSPQCYAFFRTKDNSGTTVLGAAGSWMPIGNAPVKGSSTDLGSQGETNFAILAHPTIANFIFVGTTDRMVFRVNPLTSPDPTWTLIASPTITAPPAGPFTTSTTSPHADARNLYWDYATGDLLVTNDGGLYKRTTPAATVAPLGDWFTLSGDLSITEGYQLGTDPRTGAIVLSAQDNSVMMSQFDGNEVSTGIWGYALTGDGSSAIMDRRFNPARMYSANQHMAGWFSLPVGGGLNSLVTFTASTPATTAGQSCGFNGNDNCFNFVTTQALNSQTQGEIMICTVLDGKCYVAVHPLVPGGTGGSVTALEFDPAIVTEAVVAGVLKKPISQYVFGGMRNGVSYPSVVFAVGIWYVWARQVPASSASAISVGEYNVLSNAPANLNNYVNVYSPFYAFMYNAFLAQHPADFYINCVIDDAGGLWLTTNFGKTFTLLNDPANSNLLSLSGHTSVDTFGTGSALWVESWIGGALPLVVSTSLGLWVSFTPLLSNAATPFMTFHRLGAGSPNTMATSMTYSYDVDTLTVSMFGRGVWAMQGFTQTVQDIFNGVAPGPLNTACVATGLYPAVTGVFGFGTAPQSPAALSGTPGAGRPPFNYTQYNTMGSGAGATGAASDNGTPDSGGMTGGGGGGGSSSTGGGGGPDYSYFTITVSFSISRNLGSLVNTGSVITSDILNAFSTLSPPVSGGSLNYLSAAASPASMSETTISVQFLYVSSSAATPEEMLCAFTTQANTAGSRLRDGQYTQFIIPSSIVKVSGRVTTTCKACGAASMHPAVFVVAAMAMIWTAMQQARL